jgi:ParB-like chromosome segregation protein Spo0J
MITIRYDENPYPNEIEDRQEASLRALHASLPPTRHYSPDQLRCTEWPYRQPDAEKVEKAKHVLRTSDLMEPILMRWSGRVIDRHSWVFAARELGLPSVPCRNLDEMTEDQRKVALFDKIGEELAKWRLDYKTPAFEAHIKALLEDRADEPSMFLDPTCVSVVRFH